MPRLQKFKTNKAQVLLIGSGGVGTIASLGLELGGHAQVTSVLRSDYEKVRDHGFSIESVDHGNFENWRPTKGTVFFFPFLSFLLAQYKRT